MPVAARLYYYSSQSENIETLPVVLIHGAGGNHLYWPSEIRRLPGYRIFALDLPGHGRSEGRGEQSIAAYAQRVREWLEAMEMHQAVFVGHSMGSAIVLSLAVQHPEHVLGLGLVGAGGRLRVRPDLLADTANPTTFHKATGNILAGSFAPQADPRLVELAGQRMNEIRPTVLHGDLLACNSFDLLDQIGQINRPALVICGVEDQMTPLRYGQALAGSIPGAVLKVIPEAGHMVQLEKPVEVAQALANFLENIPYHPGETRGQRPAI